MNSIPRLIDPAASSYLKGQLETGRATQTKKALQDICKLYRTGYRVPPDHLIGIENEIIGLTFSSEDLKVRRWALNALAQLGRKEACKQAILHAIQIYGNDAEVVAAAIAALYRQSRTAPEDLRRLGFNEQMLTLAALQHVPAEMLDLSALPLDVEHADEELVKLGLVVVGLNKAPPNMFDPDYDNSEIVRVLGKHHDPIVSQYSVWAITENPTLGVEDLGVALKNIEQQSANVRAWVFRLLAMDAANIEKHIDYIKLGIDDSSAESRAGLAVGLRHTYSPVLRPLVLEWFTRELDPEVRQHLVDHLILQAESSDAYNEHALDTFERASAGSPTRQRMLATAAGTPMFSKLSLIQYGAARIDLLGGPTIVNNKTIRQLEKQFGEAWVRYKDRVRRWI